VVHVLVLVHEDVPEPHAERPADLRALEHEPLPVQEEVVVVHPVCEDLALEIAVDDRADRIDLREEVRVLLGDHVVELPPRVDAQGDDRAQEVALREPALRDRDPHVGRRGLEEVLRVLRVEDGEVRPEPEELGVRPEEARRHRVERAGGRPHEVRSDEGLDATLHLARGTVREREEEERRRVGSVLDEPRDAVDERARLARAGARDDERRAVRREDDGLLLLVQLARVIDAVALRDRAPEDVLAGRGRAVRHARRLPLSGRPARLPRT